ncbi:MAG: phosphotransferase family protein [Acidiferrobacterales bacterium]
MTTLTGGVSSDIWRVDLVDGPICIKRALPKLKVAAQWQVPVERNAYEYAWMDTVSRIRPQAVPHLIGHDPESGLFAMAYLDPSEYPVWKSQLREGRADSGFAAQVGATLVVIHCATAGDGDIETRFASDAIFHAIRLEPYLIAASERHPDLAEPLRALVETTATTKCALVHGDVSPKNILVRHQDPVFLDAECAWYGDPAFDLAFCLNHFLLKCLWTPYAANEFLACFRVLADTYLTQVSWEPRHECEARAAHLLPGLFLARVDGKSPVEYLTDERDKDRVRKVARTLLREPTTQLEVICNTWAGEIGL